MNNSTGFIITGIVVGLSLVVGGAVYLSNKSTTPSYPPVQIMPSKEDQGYFYSGGNRTKRKRNKQRKTYKK